MNDSDEKATALKRLLDDAHYQQAVDFHYMNVASVALGRNRFKSAIRHAQAVIEAATDLLVCVSQAELRK